MTCKNTCLQYKIGKYELPVGKSPYDFGLAYCSICEVYIDTSLLHCLCCGFKMRRHGANGNKYLKKEFVRY